MRRGTGSFRWAIAPLLAGFAAGVPAQPAAAAPATAAQAAHVVYGGTIGSGGPTIVLQASADGRRLRSVALWAELACDDGSRSSYAASLDFQAGAPVAVGEGARGAFFPDRVSRRGKFSATGLVAAPYGDNAGALDLKLSGTLKDRTASGTLSVTLRLVNRADGQAVTTCRSGTLRWRASSSPDQVFGGTTSDDRPVVLELARDRRSARALLLGWVADCQPSGTGFTVPDSFVGLPVSRLGRLGERFEQTLDVEGGVRRTVAYDIAGRVRRTRATGTFSVVVTDRDAAGTVVDTCSTGTLRWSAGSSRMTPEEQRRRGEG